MRTEVNPIFQLMVILAFVFAIGFIAQRWRWSPVIFTIMVIALTLESLWHILRRL